MFEIAQTAMNESRRGAGRTGAKFTLFDQQHFQPAHRRVASDPGAVDSCTDYHHTMRNSSHHIVSAVHCLRQSQSRLFPTNHSLLVQLKFENSQDDEMGFLLNPANRVIL